MGKQNLKYLLQITSNVSVHRCEDQEGEEVSKVFFGDCRESMRQMIADGVKVQMCVTSPPYYGLRDYGHGGQLGLEATPEEFIKNMVRVFRLVRDLLNDDGVLWLNIGDSYNANQGSGFNGNKRLSLENRSTVRKRPSWLKPKDLIGIPWMLAFALRNDGWYLRQDVIWSKPNPMPESVTDRCTRSHEYLFLLTKNSKYYYDSEAIREKTLTKDNTFRDRDSTRLNNTPGRKRMGGLKTNNYETRNKRSVWSIATKPYSGAHFATFPSELIKPCILAGSRPDDVVLDPFFGSGTTGQVCESLGRQWIGCELNREYESLQKDRTAQKGLVFI